MKERRKAREILMKILYCYDLTGEYSDNFESFLTRGHAHLFVLDNEDMYSIDDTDIYTDNMKIDMIKEYLEFICPDVFDKLDEIDEMISNYLRNWPIGRICEIDKAILRLAIYEILFCDKIPEKVSINEAVELSKKYSSKKSRKFINGLLDSVYKKEFPKRTPENV